MKKITCEEARELITLYVAGVLEEKERLEEHLRDCANCRRRVEEERRVEELLMGIKPYPVPKGLKEAILRSTKQVPIPLWRRGWFWASVSAVAVAALILSLVLIRPEPQRLEAAPLKGEVLFPSQDAVLLAKDFKVVFVYAPERQDIEVSVYIDDGEVTGTAKSVDGVIIYQSEEVEEGYHTILVKLRDPESGAYKEFQRTIYVVGSGS
jgi:hypothetical protein